MSTIKEGPMEPGQIRWIERGIFAYRTKKKLRYGISFLDGNRRRQQIVADTLTEARRALEARRTDVHRGDYQHQERKPSPTFREYANRYLEQAASEKRSIRRDDLTVRAALPLLGDKRLDQIGPADIRVFRQARLDGNSRGQFKRRHDGGVSKATVNRDLAVVKHILERAVDDGLLHKNPSCNVKMFRVQERDRRVLSQVEERRLLAAAAAHLRPLLVVALNTGLRRSELMGLQWSDVDLETGYVLVRRQTKSYKNRSVPLNPKVRTALLGLRRESLGHVFGFKGNPVEDVKKSLASACQRAQIAHCTLHSCRHTFATRLVLAGVPLPVVQKLLGHASITTTMRYAHPAPADAVEAVNMLCEDTADVPKSSESGNDSGDRNAEVINFPGSPMRPSD